MCVDHKITCACGKNSASFNFKDDILPVDVVSTLYCPACPGKPSLDPETMLSDNGWIIDYDLDIARFMAAKLPRTQALTPAYIFDQGFCTWRGVYPNDHIDSASEREELLKLAKTDKKKYFEEIKAWSIKRLERLAREGWRKAREQESVCA